MSLLERPSIVAGAATASNAERTALPDPAIISVDMGYGHLRASQPLSDLFGVDMLRADQPPLADAEDQQRWQRVRNAHAGLSRLSHLPLGLGSLMRSTMDAITMIEPLHGPKDLSVPNLSVRALDALIDRGLGRGMVDRLRESGAPLLTTFYAPSIIADRAGLDQVYCVATDADIHRIWAPMHAATTRIVYLAPSNRVVRRLRAYGVPDRQIRLTGFPLPPELLGGREFDVLRQNLARRLVRLDVGGTFRRAHTYELERILGNLPRDQEGVPPLLTFAVGGAGAQAEMADAFLGGLRSALVEGRLRLALVAGIRAEVRTYFEAVVDRHKLGGLLGNRIQIVHEADFTSYYRRFNALLAETDVLWTKPSEMSFYAALGLALVLAKPLGTHERYNRLWLREAGAALKQESLEFSGGWLSDWLHDGTLAGVAWSGFSRLPKLGTYTIEDIVRERRTSRRA